MIFVSLAIHRPKPDQAAGMVDAMHRFGAAARGAPGLLGIYTLRDGESEALIGLALWDSAEAFHAARPAMRAAIADVDFTLLEDDQPEVFLLAEIPPIPDP
jgi:heme-degrading monooxygenase HmoA